jgi:hypothetical protein
LFSGELICVFAFMFHSTRMRETTQMEDAFALLLLI